MFRSIRFNQQGIIGLSFSQLGLLIATAVLLISLYSLFFDSDTNENYQMQRLADTISSELISIDKTWFETTSQVILNKDSKGYQITLSPYSVHISKDDEPDYFFRKFLLRKCWIRSNDDDWKNGSELHQFLFDHFGLSGSNNEPISINFSAFMYIASEWNMSRHQYIHQPYLIDSSDPLFFEKILLHIDANNDGLWQENEPVESYVLFFQ